MTYDTYATTFVRKFFNLELDVTDRTKQTSAQRDFSRKMLFQVPMLCYIWTHVHPHTQTDMKAKMVIQIRPGERVQLKGTFELKIEHYCNDYNHM